MPVQFQTAIDPSYSPILYTPDYTFLRYVLDKKTQRYEQGLSAVSSAYSNLQKELSDPTNIQRRDQYLKNAESQLQKVAGSDLSLQENVNAAQSIFDPISTNKAFIYDSYWTGRNKKALAKIDNWKYSENPEERKKYNPELEAWLRRDLNSLKTGQGNIDNYKVQGRDALAYIDPQELISTQAKADGFEYKVDSLGQPYIVSTTGGPGGKRNYEEYARNVLSNNPLYQRQIAALSENRQESVLEQYRALPEWANKSDLEIYKDASIKSYDKHKTQDKSYLDGIEKSLITEDADIKAYVNLNKQAISKGEIDFKTGNQTPEAQIYAELVERINSRNSIKQQLISRKDQYEQMYGKEGTPESLTIKQNYIDQFSKDPKNFYADQQFKNDITTFSNLRSASIKREIKEDRAYVDITVAKTNALATMAAIKDKIEDNLRADAKLNLDVQKEAFKESLQGKKVVTNADGTKTVVETEAEIKPVDVSATQVTALNAIKKLQDNVTLSSAEALNAVIGTNGGLTMLESMKIPSEDVIKVRDIYNRYWNSGKGSIELTPEEKTLLKDVKSHLISFASNNKNNTLTDAEKSDENLNIADLPTLLQKAVSGYTPTTQTEILAMSKIGNEYTNAISKLNTATKGLEVAQKYVIEKIKNTEVGAVLNDDKTRIINSDDVYKSLKNVYNQILYDPGTFSFYKPSGLSDDDLKKISEAYINGELNVGITPGYLQSKSDIWIDGKSTFNYNGKDYAILIPQTGSSGFPLSTKKFQEYVKKINEETPLPEFGDAKGMVYGSPFYKLTGQAQTDVLDDLGALTPTNSNVWEYNEGTAEPKQVSPKDQETIRNAIISRKDISKNGVLLYTSHPLNKGGQAVGITFDESTKENDKPIYSGKTYYFPISPTPSSPEVFHIFENASQVSEYDEYKKLGKTYHLDTFQGAGIKVEIYPISSNSDQGYIKIYQKEWNEATKSYSNDFTLVTDDIGSDLTFDLSKITFPEIKEKLYNEIILPYVQQKIKFNNQVKKTEAAASGGTMRDADAIFNSLMK